MEADISVGTPDEPSRSRHRRGRGRKIAVITVAVLAVAGAGVAAIGVDKVLDTLGVNSFGSKAAANDTPPPATAKVTRETLRQTQDADGELGYGPSTTVASRKPGTVTWLPDGGDTVKRGDPLFAVDTLPTTLMYGKAPAYRDLKVGDEGTDVKQLESNLDKLGYDGFTVDREFTAETATAVKQWQDDLGLKETGTVALGQVVFADGATRIDSFEAEIGQATGPEKSVLSYTGTDKVVTIEVDSDDQQLAKVGAKATVSMPDGETTDGEITDVSSVIKPGEGQEEATTVIQVLVSLDDDKAAKGLDQASVTATFTASEREDVLTVPVAALIALEGGGFGVEVVDGGKTEQVEVETGLFASGRVEISGSGIAEGTVVGVPE